MRYLKWTLLCFVILCSVLVLESGVFTKTGESVRSPILLQTTEGDASGTSNASTPPETGLSAGSESASPQIDESVSFTVIQSEENDITIGSPDPESGYKYQIELSSKGAAIKRATFSEFDNRNHKNPEPLNIIMPSIQSNASEVFAMANSEFMFPDYRKQLRLENLYWKSFDPETASDGSVSVRFEATILETNTNQPVIKITKIYTIRKDTFLLDCNITVENLSNSEKKVRFNLTGPAGLDREGCNDGAGES